MVKTILLKYRNKLKKKELKMNKKAIVVASSNKGKIREIKEIFKDYEVLPIKEIEERLGKK